MCKRSTESINVLNLLKEMSLKVTWHVGCYLQIYSEMVFYSKHIQQKLKPQRLYFISHKILMKCIFNFIYEYQDILHIYCNIS